MRARSRRSFEMKDLAEIIKRCHDANILGYLTLNTLLYEHVLDAVMQNWQSDFSSFHGH